MSVIGIREDEYGNLRRQVEQIHRELEVMVEMVKNKIEEINGPDKGFEAEQVNKNIGCLLGEIEEERAIMERMFEEEERLIKSFRIVVDNYDSCGTEDGLCLN